MDLGIEMNDSISDYDKVLKVRWFNKFIDILLWSD